MANATDFKVKRGLVVSTTATILSTTNATSTTTGALIVAGGAGIAKDLFVAGTISAVNTASALVVKSNISMVSPDAASTITIRMLNSDAISFSGNSGQLFSITDSMTGTIFAVNDISGVPSIEVYDTGEVRLAETFGYVRIPNFTSATSTTTGALRVDGGVGIGGDLYVGGIVSATTVTATTLNGNLTGSASTSTNLSGGATGSIPYQTAAGRTSFIGIGSIGQILQSNGTTATWVSTGSLIAGTAFTATAILNGTAGQILYQSAPGVTAFAGPGTAGQILVSAGTSAPVYTSTASIYVGNSARVDTSGQTANATYYPTFVDANNASAANELVYTTSSFAINPATGNIGIGTITPATKLQVEGTIRFATNGAGANYLEFQRTIANNWKLTSDGVGDIISFAGNSITMLQDTTIQRGGLTVSPTLAGAQNAINITQTWNTTATVFTLVKGNVTDTASSSTSLLMDLQTSGVSRAKISKGGELSLTSTYNGNVVTLTATDRSVQFGTNMAADGFGIRGSLELTRDNGVIRFYNNNGTILYGIVGADDGAANTLAQRNGVNAQTFRVYNTYTNASNYERAKIGWNSNVLEIGSENLGTGSLRNINLIGGNVGVGISTPASKLHVSGDARITGITTVTNTTVASSTITGAFQVAGGVGIGGNLYIGSDSNIAGNEVVTGTLRVNSTNANTATNTSNAFYTAGGAWIDKTLVVGGETTFKGSVVFQGTNTFVYSSSTVYTDNLISLHAPVGSGPGSHTWTVDDGKDIGFMFHYYKGSDKDAFLGFANDTQYLEWYSNGTESGGIFTGTSYGIFKTGGIRLVGGEANSGNTTTGDLQVLGGAGIGGGLFVGGTVTATSFVGSFNGSIVGAATQVNTVQQTANATYYPTFVDSNNVSAGGESVYTTGSFAINPSSGDVSIKNVVVTGYVTATSALLVYSGGTNQNISLLPSGTGQLQSTADVVAIGNNYNAGAKAFKFQRVENKAAIWSVPLGSFGQADIRFTTGGTAVSTAKTEADATVRIAPLGGVAIGNTYLAQNPADGVLLVSSNIGVGTTTPASKLHVEGDARITGITTVTNTTVATSTITGAFQVVGGAGIGGALFVGGSVNISSGVVSTNTGTGALVVNGGVGINGALNAITKSFNIGHPTKPGMTLRYGSLEGPEFGVYVRGRLKGSNTIELPEYWTKLVDPDTITVNLTPVGSHQKLYVEDIVDNTIVVGNENIFGKAIDCFYTVWAERADIDKLQVESE